MKKHVLLLLFANIIILLLMITACSKKGESTVNFLNFDEVVIEYQNSQDEKEDITLTDELDLIEITKAYDLVSINETSEPMGYPRFLINFKKNSSSVADWNIDNNHVTSGSQFGLGNHKIINGETIYESIKKIFSSNK